MLSLVNLLESGLHLLLDLLMKLHLQLNRVPAVLGDLLELLLPLLFSVQVLHGHSEARGIAREILLRLFHSFGVLGEQDLEVGVEIVAIELSTGSRKGRLCGLW